MPGGNLQCVGGHRRPSDGEAMLCTADCNKTKAQRLEWLQVRLMRRCNEKCGLGFAIRGPTLLSHQPSLITIKVAPVERRRCALVAGIPSSGSLPPQIGSTPQSALPSGAFF